ncbi:MAG: hypothetical protein JWR16_319 [Nevskia sp.]|nr:hypothetical protein [Nevskia sp.]
MSTESRVLVVAGVVLLSACASRPSKPPLTPLQEATLAVARADETRVGDFAYEDMRNARERLVEARDASIKAQQGKDSLATLNARQFADEAIADAELATAKAQLARVRAASFALQQQLGLVPVPQPEVFSPEEPESPPMPQPAPPADAPLQPLPDTGGPA